MRAFLLCILGVTTVTTVTHTSFRKFRYINVSLYFIAFSMINYVNKSDK